MLLEFLHVSFVWSLYTWKSVWLDTHFYIKEDWFKYSFLQYFKYSIYSIFFWLEVLFSKCYSNLIFLPLFQVTCSFWLEAQKKILFALKFAGFSRICLQASCFGSIFPGTWWAFSVYNIDLFVVVVTLAKLSWIIIFSIVLFHCFFYENNYYIYLDLVRQSFVTVFQIIFNLFISSWF